MSSDRRMTDADAVLAIMNGVRRIETLEAQLAERDARINALALQADEWEGKYAIVSEMLAERDARIAKLIAAGDRVVEAALSGTRHELPLRDRVEAWTEAKG